MRRVQRHFQINLGTWPVRNDNVTTRVVILFNRGAAMEGTSLLVSLSKTNGNNAVTPLRGAWCNVTFRNSIYQLNYNYYTTHPHDF